MEVANVTGIVTGGAAGLGQALAETILQGGGRVVITDKNAEQLKATGEQLQTQFGKHNVGFFEQDVTEADSFYRAIEFTAAYFGRTVNLLINNAGIPSDSRFHCDGAPRYWEGVINTNLTGVIRGTQVAADVMKKTLGEGEEGVIVNMASIAGIVDFHFAPTYAAAKAGVVHFTRSLVPLKKCHNIRVVALCPGFADTAMGRSGMSVWPQIEQKLGPLIPVERVGQGLIQVLGDGANAGRALRILDKETAYYGYAEQEFLFPDEDIWKMDY